MADRFCPRTCCMCIAHCAHTYVGSSSPNVEDISVAGGRDVCVCVCVWSYLHRKWVSTTQLCRERLGRIYTPFFLPLLPCRRSSLTRNDSSRAAKQFDRNFRSPHGAVIAEKKIGSLRTSRFSPEIFTPPSFRPPAPPLPPPFSFSC